MGKKIVLVARISDVRQRQALPAQRLRLQNYVQRFEMSKIKRFESDESTYKTLAKNLPGCFKKPQRSKLLLSQGVVDVR